MISENHNYKLQINLWHREEEPYNNHETPGKQTKQSNQLSLPHQDDCKTIMDTTQRTTKHRKTTEPYNTDWQFEMFKRDKGNGHGTGFSCKLRNSFLIFSNICCWYTLELPHRGKFQCVPITYVFPIIEFFTISFFFKISSTRGIWKVRSMAS